MIFKGYVKWVYMILSTGFLTRENFVCEYFIDLVSFLNVKMGLACRVNLSY
jgi:hypothetical protein